MCCVAVAVLLGVGCVARYCAAKVSRLCKPGAVADERSPECQNDRVPGIVVDGGCACKIAAAAWGLWWVTVQAGSVEGGG